MIDHVSIGVCDLARSRVFYEAAFAPLGLTVIGDRGDRIGFGRRYPEFWINHRPGMPRVADETGSHICLRARTPEAVAAFHEAALAHGGQDDGAPGPRQATMTRYYAAFVRDPDGHRIEVAAFPEAVT
jgi:catechol 2,3-dioxygenase-like lactoylglutathione lyase family enzyme